MSKKYYNFIGSSFYFYINLSKDNDRQLCLLTLIIPQVQFKVTMQKNSIAFII